MGSGFFWPLLIAFAIGYVFGSIPFGLILTRAAGLGDVRNIGSGNIGATNVLRTGRKGLAAATLVLDALKGTAAVLVTLYALRWLFPMMPDAASRHSLGLSAPWAAALGAVSGHMFPVWLGFKGGKGVATLIGVLIPAHPYGAGAFAVAWLLVAALTRYSSLSSLVATLVVLVVIAIFAPAPFALAAFVLMTLLVFWKHRENIARLIAGKESRIGAKG